MSGPEWIFGYGSLVFRPDFPFAEARPAWLHGYARQFWQGSTDHRGVPGAPGRVVTLTERVGASCLGLAYRVAPEDWPAAIATLDHRESGGYERREVVLELEDAQAETIRALVYFAAPGNPNYLGEASIEDMARQVRAAAGPSGANLEYVVRLAAHLRELGVEEDPVLTLEAALGSGG